MANLTLFDSTRGDVRLTAALLAQIRAGTITLTLFGDKGDFKFNAPAAEAVVAGTSTVKVLHGHNGHNTLDSATLSRLT